MKLLFTCPRCGLPIFWTVRSTPVGPNEPVVLYCSPREDGCGWRGLQPASAGLPLGDMAADRSKEIAHFMTPRQNAERLERIAELRKRLEHLRPVVQAQFAKRPEHSSPEMTEVRSLKAELDRLEHLEQIESVEDVGEA